MKVCRGCGESKSEFDFHVDNGKADGRNPRCKACISAYGRSRADKAREYYLANREQKLKSLRDFRNADPVRALEKKMRAHGVSMAWYDSALAAQGGGCAICGTDSASPNARFSVDHDHKCCPGQYGCAICVRGLLCPRCNVAIGMLDDDPVKANAAHEYLSRSA